MKVKKSKLHLGMIWYISQYYPIQNMQKKTVYKSDNFWPFAATVIRLYVMPYFSKPLTKSTYR